MSDESTSSPGSVEGQAPEIPQDRVSLLRGEDGNVFPYVPPAVSRQRLEGALATALGQINDFQLVLEFYQQELARQIEENQRLRAQAASPLDGGTSATG